MEQPLRIALTFDDGPNTTITPQVLDILEAESIPASFFLIGKHITPASAEVARRAVSMGCDLENHSMTHGFMNQTTPETIREEINGCTALIRDLSGSEPRFFRPPYIAVNQTLFDEVPLTFICGSNCRDWEPDVSAEERLQMLLSNARDGEIVLLHDMEGNIATVEALRRLIPLLKARGFRFFTCPGLFEACGVTPQAGRLYSNVFQTTDRP